MSNRVVELRSVTKLSENSRHVIMSESGIRPTVVNSFTAEPTWSNWLTKQYVLMSCKLTQSTFSVTRSRLPSHGKRDSRVNSRTPFYSWEFTTAWLHIRSMWITESLLDDLLMYFASFSVFFAINQVLGHFKENTRSLQLVCAQLRYV